jgi:predicted DNA-binding transcriptional regulator YafY
LRLPPLMFTAAEAVGLVMAVLEGHRDAANPADLVGSALAKIVRVLPDRVARPVRAYRTGPVQVTAPETSPDPVVTTELIQACTAARRVRLAYRLESSADRTMDVDPWAVVLRHSRWYLLGWSHTAQARRVLRVDRITAVDVLPDSVAPPPDLDALRTLEEHLSQGWTHPVDVLVDASVEETVRWLPRSLGLLEPDGGKTRIRATTDQPEWYVRQLAVLPVPFRVLASAELQRAAAELGRELIQASDVLPG